MIRVYICHPYSGDVRRNVDEIQHLCRWLVEHYPDVLPIAPQLYLPSFVDEATQRDQAMRMCIDLTYTCSAVLVLGDRISAGMRQEIREVMRPTRSTVMYGGRHPAELVFAGNVQELMAALHQRFGLEPVARPALAPEPEPDDGPLARTRGCNEDFREAAKMLAAALGETAGTVDDSEDIPF